MKHHHTTQIYARIAGAVLLTFLAVWPARASYESLMLSHSPVAFWEFTETNSSPPLNIVSNLSSLGSIGNGYLVGTFVTKGNPGLIGSCVNFPNPEVASDVGACEAKIEVPWNAALNPYPPLSIEFWAEPTALSYDSVAGYCPLSNMDPNGYNGGNRSGWLFYCDSSGEWHFRLGTTDGYAGVVNATNGYAAANVWQHIVATWDGTNAILYANGVQIGTVPASVANWTDNSESFIRFGATALVGDDGDSPFESLYGNNGNRGYCGNLQHVAIYTNVLAPSTINAHYRAASTNNAGYITQILAGHPVGYWPLTDPAVTPPAPSTYPAVHNSGTLGSLADGTNQWGVLTAQPGPGYPGFANKTNALFFDGDNGYVLINESTSSSYTNDTGLHFTNNPNFITLAAWVKPGEEDFYRDIIDNGWDVNYSETFLRISPGYNYGGGNYYEVGTSDGINGFQDSVLVPIPPGDVGNWVYLVGTFDGVNWNLYRNGVLQASEPALGVGWVAALSPWTIGSRSPTFPDFNEPPYVVGQGEFWGGSIAEPAILTNTLSADDVLALYNAAEVPPVITEAVTNPATEFPATLFGGNVFQGSTVSFSVWAEGSPTLGYLWTTNGVSTGVTSTNYTINNIQAKSVSQAATYTVAVIVTNAYGTNMSSATFSVVVAPPFILTPPSPQERYVGYPFTLSTSAVGSPPLTYYWQLGNSIVASTPDPSYTTTATAGNGGNYSVIVSNATGINATSAPALVTVRQPNGYVSSVLADSPIALWRLDETSGTTAFDSVGGNNGTYFNALLGQPGYSPADPSGYATAFSGSNSYVGNISGTAINFAGSNNNSFTLEAWVNGPSGLPDQSTIIAKGLGNSGTIENEQFALDVAAGVYRFFTAEAEKQTATPVGPLASEGPDGTWQLVDGVYDSAAQTMTIYVNGVQESRVPYNAAINDTVSSVSIGSKRLGNDPNYVGTFGGLIDNVAVYNSALTQEQIESHYAAAPGTNTPPTILIQPVSVTNYAGLSVTLSIDAYGSYPFTLQWFGNGEPLMDGPDISGSTNETLTLSSLDFSEAGTYYVHITNSYYSGGVLRAGATNSASVRVVVLAPPTNPPVIPGLVMHLPFDNSLQDITGRGNNGTGMYTYIPGEDLNATNAVTVEMAPDTNSLPTNLNFYFKPDGVFGPALHVSTMAVNTGGTTSIGTNDYYVTLGVRPDLQFGTNSFTVSYWVRTPIGYGDGPSFGGGGDLPFFCDAVGSTFNNGFTFATSYGFGTASPTSGNQDPGSWGLSIWNGGGVGYWGSEYTLINDGYWHHLVHIVDRDANRLSTYVDGLLSSYTPQSGSTELSAAGNINVTNAATIGQDPTGHYGETGNFDLDDLCVWNRALSPLEAASIYISGVSNQLSVTAPVSITMVPTNGNRVAVFWPAGVPESSSNVLQSSATPSGGYTNVTGASSPYILTPSGHTKYFRVQQIVP